jgi:hypothetical protein
MSLALTLVTCTALCAWSDDGHGATTTDSRPVATTTNIDEASSPLNGRWRAAETEAEKAQRLQAIDRATERMGPLLRGKARGRLAERTSPRPSLTIEIEGSKLAIASGDRRLELELGGPPLEVAESEGRAQVSAKMEGDQLVVETRGDNGGRTTTYRADGGRLSMEVTMTGDRLAGPVVYATTYVRAE